MKKQPKKLSLRKETVYSLELTAAELRAIYGGSVDTGTDLEKKTKRPTSGDDA